MKKVLCILGIIVLIVFGGCNSTNNESKTSIVSQQASQNPTISAPKQSESTVPELESNKRAELIKAFEEAFPKAEIVSKTTTDIDNDNQEDLIIIFNNPNKDFNISKSNICVVTQDDLHVLDLAGGNLDFQFALGSDSLKIIQNPTRISVVLHNVKTNKDIDYQVTVTTNKKTKETNFKIKTEG